MLKIISEIKNFYLGLLQKKRFLNKMEVNLSYVTLFIFLSAVAVLFEGISVGLLVPLIKGIIEMNFGFARKAPVIRDIIAMFPQLFVRPNSSVFILLLGFIFCAALTKNIIYYLSLLGMHYQVRQFSSNMKKHIIDRYMSFGKLFFDRTSQGYHHDLILNLTAEVSYRLKHVCDSVKCIFLLFIYFILMTRISWKLTAFIVVVPPILYYSVRWLIKKIERTSKYYVESRTAVSGRIYNILTCLTLVKSYNMERKEKRNFNYDSARLAGFEFSMDKKKDLSEPLQEVITIIVFMLLVSLMAFLYVREGVVELAAFLVYFYLLKRITFFLSDINRRRTEMASSAGPLNEIMKVFDNRDKYFVTEGNKVFSRLKRVIEFNHLNFFYLSNLQVLHDVTFSIEKGKMTAIVGPTGVGKTTIINLLLRFYDCPPSSIKIDGVDIRDFTLNSLRSHIALVNQETLLFNETIKRNIAYGKDKISKDKLIDVIKKARLYDYITSLPMGLDTYVGDRGIKLSGGEKQRVAIARALLKGTEILLLDEATSSLDTRTEKLIQEAIEEAVKGRTTIVIAHRLSTVRNADKVVVIDKGRVIEQGSLEELLERKGTFYEYWQEQKFF